MDDTKTQKISSQAAVNGNKSGDNTPYSKSVANLRALIHGEVTPVVIPARGEKPERTLYKQRAYLVGGRTDVGYDITHFEAEKALQAGVYLLGADILTVNSYGSLEAARFVDDAYIFARELTPEDLRRFDKTVTDRGDLG